MGLRNSDGLRFCSCSARPERRAQEEERHDRQEGAGHYGCAVVGLRQRDGVRHSVVFSAPCAMCLLLWATVNHDAVVCRVLRSTPMRTLGVLSFGIYMWHPVAQALVNTNYGPLAAAPEFSVELRDTISFILYLGLSIGIAAATYGLIERPVLNLKTRLAGSSPSHHGAGQPPIVAHWGRIAAAVAVGAVLVEAALLAELVGVTWPGGMQIGFRYAPGSPRVLPTGELTKILGVRVETAPGVNQFLIRAAEGSADLSRLGTIHTDLGYAVGVTLPGGTQIGFRYAPGSPRVLPATR